MKLTLAILISFFSFNSFAQDFDCDKLLDEPLKSIKQRSSVSDSIFLKDIEILKHCGHLEDKDSLLLKGPIIGTLLLKTVNTNQPVTYRVILQELLKVKDSEEYRSMLLLDELGSQKVDLNLWEDKKNTLKMLGLSDTELIDFKNYIKKNQLTNLTFKQAYSFYYNQNKKTEVVSVSYAFKPLTNYKKALTEAKESNKLLLIYFTGYGAVNCRKMEAEILIDKEIKSMLDKRFLAYNVYVDDKTELPSNEVYYSKITKKKITTIGQKFAALQIEKYANNSQPYFVIVDKNEKILNQIGTVTSKNDFIGFLKQQ